MSVTHHLGINLGFAVNRYPEADEWARIVGGDLGLKYVQFSADLLNPDLPAAVIREERKRIQRACRRHDIQIISTFTGYFTRVNHLAHPDPDIRRHWIAWFKKYVDISVSLGAESMGSHIGIFSAKDNQNPRRRTQRRKEAIEGWHDVAAYAKKKGLRYLVWEPMSIHREQGETLAEAHQLHLDVNRGSPLPFLICLDVDHGDVSSTNPDDTNPYVWLREFSAQTPLVHLKQSSNDKRGHWPFTKEFNAGGRIHPSKVLEALNEAPTAPIFEERTLLFELNFREREPDDSRVVEVLKETVDYWRPYIKY